MFDNYTEALKAGDKFYFTGNPCCRGHICNRYAKKRSCVLCVREDSYNRSKTEKVKAQNKAYKKTDQYKESQKEYKKNGGAKKEVDRVSKARKADPKKYRDRDKKYRLMYREKRLAQNKKWRSENPLNCFVRDTLKRIEQKVSVKKYEEILGYSKGQFIDHIESKFKDGMSWDNRHEWHIDHIKPVSLFIKEGVNDLSVINDLPNLQPLWASENISKGSKY